MCKYEEQNEWWSSYSNRFLALLWTELFLFSELHLNHSLYLLCFRRPRIHDLIFFPRELYNTMSNEQSLSEMSIKEEEQVVNIENVVAKDNKGIDYEKLISE